MFTSHTGTPYGGHAINGVPNASAGAGNPGLYGPNAPMPSGGFAPSVYNKSLDNVANDIPSVYYQPSNHPRVSKDFAIGDLVFVPVKRALYGQDTNERVDYDVRSRQSTGKAHVPLMTIMSANEELVRLARENKSWTSDPEIVSQWMTPIGAVIGVDVALGARGQQVRGVNVCVSRRALVSNTFMGERNGRLASGMDAVGVLYLRTKVQTEVSTFLDVVQLWTVLIPDGEPINTHFQDLEIAFDASHGTHASIQITPKGTGATVVPLAAVAAAAPVVPAAPPYAVVYVGRVLHSPPRCPTMLECAKLCLGRDPNVRPSNVEVVLGNL